MVRSGLNYLFLARHPTVTFRTPEAVTGASSTVSESDVRGWFEQIRIYMTENNYYNILADPSRVFNGDETNFVLCPKTGIVLSSKGEKNVYEIDHAQAKTSLTVMFTFGADGQLTPPMVIFPNKRLPGEITSKIPEDWGVGLSDNGWMNSDVFFEYIKNVLHPHLVKTGTQFPVILFVDGHKSHLTFAISELCTSLSIILIALYPNCTRLLQPADVAAFKPLKTQWQKTVLEWRRNNPSQALTKIQFVPLLKDTIDKSVKASTIINGFRATGLCPFNADAVDYSKCLGTANKNNNALTQPRHVTDDRVLTKDDFIKLLGESAIHKIDKKELRPEESSDYLLKIWNFFTTSPNDLQVSSSLETVNQNGNIGKFDIENMEIIFNNSPNQNVAEQSFDLITQEVVFEEIVQCSEVNDFTEDISAQQPFNQLESMEHISSPKASTSLQHPSISQPSFTYVPSTEQPTTPHLSTETSIYQTSVSNQQQLSIYTTPQKPSIRVTGDVKIGADQNNCMQLKAQLGKKDNKVIKLQDILVLPKTPQRKGIKNTKKTPFVLTSAEWKAQENEKIKIKEEKAEGVKKRKEEREQKKLEKEKKVVKKNKKNTKAKDNVTKMLFSEDFYKLDNGKLEAALEEMNKENQKAGTSKNYSAAEIEKMLTETDSDD